MKLKAMAMVVGCTLVLTACGGGGGGGGGANVPVADNPGPPPPADFDMSFHGIHSHQDYYGNTVGPQFFGIDWSVRNDSDWSPGTVEWQIREVASGQVVRGTMSVGANAAVGDGHNVHAEMWEVTGGDASWFTPGRHEYVVTIDPDNKTREAESNRDNNSHTLIVEIPEGARAGVANDLRYYSREAHVHEAMPNNRFVFHFQVENTGTAPVAGVTWMLRSDDVPVTSERFVIDETIPPGGRVQSSAGITITQPGEHVVEMILDPDDVIGTDAGDADAGNNIRRFTIIVGDDGSMTAPIANG